MSARAPWRRISRYAAGSVVSFGVAEVTFVLLFEPHVLGARGASIVASVAGIIPGYSLNRRWTWGRRGRSDFWREVVPYWATAIVSTLIAAWVIGAVNGAFADDSRQTRTIINAAAYMATYGVIFVAKYILFDKILFVDHGTVDHGTVDHGTAERAAASAGAASDRPGLAISSDRVVPTCEPGRATRGRTSQ